MWKVGEMEGCPGICPPKPSFTAEPGLFVEPAVQKPDRCKAVFREHRSAFLLEVAMFCSPAACHVSTDAYTF